MYYYQDVFDTGKQGLEIGTVMSLKAIGKRVLTVGVAIASGAALVTTLAGCDKDVTGIAAAVNSEKIQEQTVTDFVESYRESQDLGDATAWSRYMQSASFTPSSLREDVIEYYARMMLAEQDAENHGAEVTDDEVQQRIDEDQAYYGLSDEDWNAQIASMGYSETLYEEQTRYALIQEKLMDAVIEKPEVTDDQLVQTANLYGDNLNGAKRITVIVLDKGTEDEQSILDGINDGTQSFDEANEKYGKGDMYDGWNVFNTLDSQLTEAISSVEAGGMTGIVNGLYYDFIARVDETLTVPEGGFTEIGQIPETMRETLSDTVSSVDRSNQLDDYINDLYEKATITITDMPDGLPYDVSAYGIAGSDVDYATSSVTLDVDDTTTIFGCTVPFDSSKGLPDDSEHIATNWSSSDEKIVTVDQDGYVRAIAPGTATITGKNADDDSVSAEITVKVNEPSEDEE